METLGQASKNNSLSTNTSSTCLISNCSEEESEFQVRCEASTGTISPLDMNDLWGRGGGFVTGQSASENLASGSVERPPP